MPAATFASGKPAGRVTRGWLPAAVWAQACLLIATALCYGVLIVTQTHLDGVGAAVNALLIASWGLSLLWFGVGLWRGRSWPRVPTLVSELFLLVGCWPLLMADRWLVRSFGAILGIVAVLVTVALLSQRMQANNPGTGKTML